MKQINLSKGKHTLVDDGDYGQLIKYDWYFNLKGAAVRKQYLKGNKQKVIYMHRQIMNCPEDLEIDHINHDPLDNQKKNLRICNRSQNNFNLRINKKNTSGFKGVSFIKNENTWRVYISLNNRQVHLGRFKTKQEAARAYNQAALELRGAFAWINPL